MKPSEVVDWLIGFGLWVVVGGTLTAIGGIVGAW